MKKFLKKAAAVFMAAMVLATVYTPVASAETQKVTVHVKDGASWGSMNAYIWSDAGELAGVWPGSAMTEEGDGWYTASFDTEVALNFVFCASSGAPQSSNIEGVAADAGEIWVVIGGESDANDLGAATVKAELFTEAEEGWPGAAAATEEVAEETTETTADMPKTGENTPVMAVVLLALAAVSATMVVVMKKKEQRNEL
jgi:LPXTG-motif cell wall-anchored protein